MYRNPLGHLDLSRDNFNIFFVTIILVEDICLYYSTFFFVNCCGDVPADGSTAETSRIIRYKRVFSQYSIYVCLYLLIT
jgi:hypothetical protein